MRLASGIAIAVFSAAALPAAAQSSSSADALRDAAFAPKTAAQAVDSGAKLVERDAWKVGQGPVVWQSGEVRLSGADTLRVNLGGALRVAGGLPILLQQRGRFEPRDLDVTLIHSWPDALSLDTDHLRFAFSPHAGVGFSSLGGQAEAGAMLRVSRTPREDKAVQRLRDLGINEGSSQFGATGRWYLFAAASGRAVGLNMLHDERGWDRAGWTTDPTASLVGDAQVGVGWRMGDLQSSFGVIHREVKGQHMIFGQQTRDDTVAAFSFSIRPGR